MKKVLLLIILGGFYNYSISQTTLKKIDSIHYKYPETIIKDKIIEINNPTNNVVDFSFKFNKKFFFDLSDMASYVKSIMPSEYKKEPDYRKAWRFVFENTITKYYDNEYSWEINPLIYINSRGGSILGQNVFTMVKIWHELGYHYYVYNLIKYKYIGEVRINGIGYVFDPDYKVYYMSSDSTIASKNELFNNKNLILNPIKPLTNYIDYYSLNRYSDVAADYYKYYDGYNFEDIDINKLINLNIPNFIFSLPGQAILQFPIYEKTKPDFFNDVNTYALVKIPKTVKDSIKVPLLIDSICNAKLILVNKKDTVSYPNFSKYFHESKEFIETIQVLEADDTVKIYYLINYKLLKIEKNNELLIYGKDAKKVKINITHKNKIIENESLMGFFNLKLKDKFLDIQNDIILSNTIEDLKGIVLLNIDDIKKYMRIFLEIKDKNNAELLYNNFENRLSILLTNLSDLQKSMVIKGINSRESLVTFYYMVTNIDNNELLGKIKCIMQ